MGKSAVKGLFYRCLIMATFALAAVTLTASFSGKYAPTESTVMPLLGLALPVLLIVNTVVALCWAFARKYWTWIPLAAILCNWSYLTAIFQYNGTKERTPGKYLKIATYNVHSFGNEITGYSCKELARYMQQEEVDVLCFQEFGDNRYFPMDSLRQVLAHWQYAHISTEDTLRGILPIAVFSRYPLANYRLITYTGSANGSLVCDVAMGTDTIRLINNHLQTTSISQNRRKWEREFATDNTRREVRAAQEAASTLHENFLKRAVQTDNICRLAADSPHPVLVCGDFNTLPSSYTYARMSRLLSDGFRTCGNGYMYTYRYFKRLLRIDYIFHSPQLRGHRYYSPDLDLCSDHNPVIMEVKIKDA